MQNKLFTEAGNFNYLQIRDRICERIEDTKKVSRMPAGLEDKIYNALKLIDAINQQPDYVQSYNGVRFEDIQIPKFLSSFIQPSKVSLKPEAKYADLRRVHSVKDAIPVDLGELKSLCDVVNSIMKAKIAPVMVSEYRRPKTLDEVKFCVTDGSIEVTCSEGSNDRFVPVPVISQVLAVVGEHVVNEDANYILNLYLDHMVFDE